MICVYTRTWNVCGVHPHIRHLGKSLLFLNVILPCMMRGTYVLPSSPAQSWYYEHSKLFSEKEWQFLPFTQLNFTEHFTTHLYTYSVYTYMYMYIYIMPSLELHYQYYIVVPYIYHILFLYLIYGILHDLPYTADFSSVQTL